MNDPTKLYNKCLNEMKEIMKEQNEIVIDDLFTAEDAEYEYKQNVYWRSGFADLQTGKPVAMISIDSANARFREWANEQTKIYTNTAIKNAPWGYDKTSLDMHVALLAFPQEIKWPIECEHEAVEPAEASKIMAEMWHGARREIKCFKCGAKLKAKWEKVE